MTHRGASRLERALLARWSSGRSILDLAQAVGRTPAWVEEALRRAVLGEHLPTRGASPQGVPLAATRAGEPGQHREPSTEATAPLGPERPAAHPLRARHRGCPGFDRAAGDDS